MAASIALTDGGIETTLLFHEGFELPHFASFPLLGETRGRAALRRYFEPFLDTAGEHGLPFVLDTATWRRTGCPRSGCLAAAAAPITATSRRSRPPGLGARHRADARPS